MAGLLLLLATLATLGSCHLADPGDSPAHYLVSRTTVERCSDAEDDWLVGEFEACTGDSIVLNDGKGTIDVSNWVEDKVAKIFAKNLDGGFTIRGSQFIGKDIIVNVELIKSIGDVVNLTVVNNLKMTDFFLEIADNSKAPRVRVSGNRLLNEESIEYLEEHLASGKIHADSHIQAYQECDLDGKVLVDVAATLKNCKAIYGDLIFDASSKFPADDVGMKSIEKLTYVQGCLRVTGTQFKSWNELTFLEGTESKKGGCTSGHPEISGNPNMCIHPPFAETLKEIFPGMTIANNQACDPECTSRHVLEKADASCVVITDSLVIGPTTNISGLAALENVHEIQGLLQVTNSSIEDFNYLPKLTKLNSKNMSAGHVINLQLNSQLKHFDLPQLQASGVGTGRPGQIKFWNDKNGPDGKFKVDDAFVKRIDAVDSQVAITRKPTTAAPRTTNAPPTPAKQLTAVERIYHNIGRIVGLAVATFILSVLVVVVVTLYIYGFLTRSKKWHSQPMKGAVEQTDIYQYTVENEHMEKARKIIEENKPKIEAVNKRHRDNQDYKLLSVLNHNATSMMPGYFQWKDYEVRKKERDKRKKEEKEKEEKEEKEQKEKEEKEQKEKEAKETKEEKEKREKEGQENKENENEDNEEDEEGEEEEEEKPKKINTLKLLAQKNGLYGLAFEASFNAEYPLEHKYRTQCDQYSMHWFKSGLEPIYVEKFASTAKRMCHMPCDAISENLRYLRSKSIKIREYGITSKGFQTETGLFGKVHGPREAEEREDLIWIKDQIPYFKFYRYREKMNELGVDSYPQKFFTEGKKNLHQFVIRMVETMMSMPVGHVLDLKASDVTHFLRVILPAVIGNALGTETKYPRSSMSAGGYSVEMNRTHVRIVGELRGDFDALRRAINIPSLLDGKDHPMLQYNWLFLGNYTGRHPQSLETIMFLLALQFLYGRDCIILLRGVMEFADTSLVYGFKENLEKRFFNKQNGKQAGENLWKEFMKVFARLPLNCRVIHAVYCCSGGFNDGDIDSKDEETPTGKFNEKTTLQSLNKIFSLPNYTVRDYFENVDTGAGYYYGERVLQKIAEDTGMYTFFTTGPMTGGVGYFCDTTPVNMFMLSSVKGLHGHGGMVTQLAAVAELNGETGQVTFHMILEEDQMVYYDPLQMKLGNEPFEEEEGGPSKKKTTTSTRTGTSTGESTTPAVTNTASSNASK